jgi:hypothetical protein
MLDLWFSNPEQIEDGSPSEAGVGKLKMLLLALKYSRSPEILSVLPEIIRISIIVEGKKIRLSSRGINTKMVRKLWIQ